MAIWKCEAEGDTVYIEAATEDAAYNYMADKIGRVPRRMITFSQVDAIPEDEVLL